MPNVKKKLQCKFNIKFPLCYKANLRTRLLVLVFKEIRILFQKTNFRPKHFLIRKYEDARKSPIY